MLAFLFGPFLAETPVNRYACMGAEFRTLSKEIESDVHWPKVVPAYLIARSVKKKPAWAGLVGHPCGLKINELLLLLD